MPRATPVTIQHRGDRNLRLAGIGAGVLLLGLLLVGPAPGVGGGLLIGGAVTAVLGLRPRAYPCPSCRTRISRRATTCPQCHTANPWGAAQT